MWALIGFCLGYILCHLMTPNKYDELVIEIHDLRRQNIELQRRVSDFMGWLDKTGL